MVEKRWIDFSISAISAHAAYFLIALIIFAGAKIIIGYSQLRRSN